MGQSSTTITTDAINNRVVGTYPLEKGTLVALSAGIPAISIRSGYIWARIGISIDGNTQAHIITTLAQGNIGSGVSLSWTGSIPLSQGMSVIIEAWGRIATTITLNAITI